MINWESREFFPEFFVALTLECSELAHISEEGDSFSSFSFCEASEHLDSCDDRVKSTIISPVDDDTIVESFESISPGMWEMDVSEK